MRVPRLVALFALLATPAYAQTWNPGDPIRATGGRSQSQTFVAPAGMEFLESVTFWLEPVNSLPTAVHVYVGALGDPESGEPSPDTRSWMKTLNAPLLGEDPSPFTVALGWGGRPGLLVEPGVMYTITFATFWWALNEVPRLPGVRLTEGDSIPSGHAYASTTWDGIGERIEGQDLALELHYMATPEPLSLTLLGTGLAGVAAARRRARVVRDR